MPRPGQFPRQGGIDGVGPQRCGSRLHRAHEPPGDEVGEFRPEQRVVGGAAPLLHRAARELRESVPAAPDPNGHDRSPLHDEPMDVVRPQVAHLAQAVPEPGLAVGSEVHAADHPVVGHTEEHHPAIGVGERHRSLGDAVPRHAFLELDKGTLTGELRREFRAGERGRRNAPGSRVEHRI